MRAKDVPVLDSEQIERFWAKVQVGAKDACWLWKGRTGDNGYGLFKIGERMVSTHRVAHFLGKGQPGELFVLHDCDIKKCCNPRHLFLGTQKVNINDYVEKGFGPNMGHEQTGEWNGNARLTEDDVRAIRASNDIQRITAARFGITQVMVSRINLRKAWSHIL
jgi:hypothetical protein